MTIGYFSVIVFFLKMLIPLAIVGIIIALVVTDNNHKRVNVQPVRYDAQGRPVYGGMNVPKKSNYNSSTVLLLIGVSFIILSAIAFVTANWVKLSDESKVFILAGAAMISFSISVILKAVAKLDLTSAAFYVLGTILSIVSVITAGNYKLFGEWFSISGEGMGLLFAVSSFILAGAAFAAYPLYKKMAFNYLGLSCVSLGIIFLAVQITDNYEQFAPVIIMAQLVITAAVHLLKPQKGTKLDLPVRVIGDLTGITYAILALFYVIGTTFKATPYTFFVLGVLMLQFIVYGIVKKQGWMYIFLNLSLYYTAFIVMFGLDNKYSSGFLMLLFSFITLIIFLINFVLPQNNIPSKSIAFAAVVFGSIISLAADNEKYFGMNIIVPLVVSVVITVYSLHKELAIQVIAGLLAPVLPFFTALFMNNRLYELNGKEKYNEIAAFTFGTLAIVYIMATVVMMYLPKLSFSVHAHHPMQTEVVLYSNMIAAAAVLLNCTRYSDLFMVAVAVCVIHFIVSNLMSTNITAAGSVISLILIVYRILQHFFGDDSEAAMYSMFALLVVLLAISRFVFPESFLNKKNNRTIVDVTIISAWMCVVPFPTFDRLSIFLRLMAVAVYLACFVKKNTDKDAAAVLLSFSSAIAAFAFITRPFLTPDSSVISSKITLAIIALLGVSYLFIWKQHKAASKVTSTILFVIAFIGLIIDAMVYHNAPNTIFVMAVTACVLIISFYAKSKTWFTVSSISLVVITVYSTRKYFMTMGWWIYLFLVGVILIAVAAANEFCKKKGETMKSAATKTFSGWKW